MGSSVGAAALVVGGALPQVATKGQKGKEHKRPENAVVFKHVLQVGRPVLGVDGL